MKPIKPKPTDLVIRQDKALNRLARSIDRHVKVLRSVGLKRLARRLKRFG